MIKMYLKSQDIFTRTNEFLPDMSGGQTEFREDCVMHVHEIVLRDVWAHLLIFCHFDRENSFCDFLFCFLGWHNPP